MSQWLMGVSGDEQLDLSARQAAKQALLDEK